MPLHSFTRDALRMILGNWKRCKAGNAIDFINYLKTCFWIILCMSLWEFFFRKYWTVLLNLNLHDFFGSSFRENRTSFHSLTPILKKALFLYQKVFRKILLKTYVVEWAYDVSANKLRMFMESEWMFRSCIISDKFWLCTKGRVRSLMLLNGGMVYSFIFAKYMRRCVRFGTVQIFTLKRVLCFG